MNKQPEIFFHVGLGKTGTTFLQYRAFPYFKDLVYIQRTQYRNAKDIIKNGGDQKRYFLSFECDQQLEEVVKDWAKDFPQTVPIIVFRQHDSWIASQFRRFLKNCHVTTFKQLLDLENDSGRFKKKDLFFMPMVTLLETHFTGEPIVLLYDDMKKDPRGFIKELALKMGSDVDEKAVDLSVKHSSYSERQLSFLMRASKYIPLRKKVVFKNRIIEFFRKSAVNWTRYLVLFVGKFWPSKENQSLLNKADLDEVKNHFSDDWMAILNRAKSSKNT